MPRAAGLAHREADAAPWTHPIDIRSAGGSIARLSPCTAPLDDRLDGRAGTRSSRRRAAPPSGEHPGIFNEKIVLKGDGPMMRQFQVNSYLFGGNAPYVEELYE